MLLVSCLAGPALIGVCAISAGPAGHETTMLRLRFDWLGTHLENLRGTRVICPEVVKSKVVVILLGWAASRVKSLERFAGIYSRIGIPVVCAAPPLPEIWFESLGNVKAKKLLDPFNKSLDAQCSVVLHLFSGAGFTFLPTIIEELRQPNSKLQLSGLVFDSGPALFSLRSGLAAAKLMHQQGGYSRLAYYSSCVGGVVVNAIVGRKRRSSMRAVLDNPAIRVPQLYLYSAVDTVALVHEVEREMELQASRGVDVSSHKWSDTVHVRHFREYPEEYTTQVHNFLNKLSFIVD